MAAGWLLAGFRLAAGKDGIHIHLLELASGEVAAVLRGHSNAINGLAWSPDGAWLASASADHTLRVWDLRRLKEEGGRVKDVVSATLQGHTDQVNGLAWVPSSHQPQSVSPGSSHIATGANALRLVSGSDDDTGRLWERRADGTWQTIATLAGHTNDVMEVACSPDGRWIATSSSDRSVRLWNANGRFEKVLGTKPGSFPTPPRIDFSPDSRWLVAADKEGNRGGAVVWSVPDGKQVSRFDGHDNTVYRAKFLSRHHVPRDEPGSPGAQGKKGEAGTDGLVTRSVTATLVASTGGDARTSFCGTPRRGRKSLTLSDAAAAFSPPPSHQTVDVSPGDGKMTVTRWTRSSLSPLPLICSSFRWNLEIWNPPPPATGSAGD
ncbi:MAG: hypothetical protein R3C49_21465 [Planctomycetaceae bacterium]